MYGAPFLYARLWITCIAPRGDYPGRATMLEDAPQSEVIRATILEDTPQSEVIRATVLEDSPCFLNLAASGFELSAAGHRRHRRLGSRAGADHHNLQTPQGKGGDKEMIKPVYLPTFHLFGRAKAVTERRNSTERRSSSADSARSCTNKRRSCSGRQWGHAGKQRAAGQRPGAKHRVSSVL